MKLWLQVLDNNSGKSKFAKLLKTHLKPHGIEAYLGIRPEKGTDVVMGFSKFLAYVKGAKHILRANGVNIIDEFEYRWRNKKIASSIKKADAVIWQSEFAQRFGHALLRRPTCPEHVIYNGSDCKPDDGTHRIPDGKIVLVVGKWLDKRHLIHKRWKELCEVMESYQKPVTFFLAGRCDFKLPSLPNVVQAHIEEPGMMFSLMKAADVMLNISCYDACPNAVVEALVSGLPVICNTGDGTEELVGKSGTVIDTGRPKPKLINRFKFKRFDVKEWHAALDHWIDNPRRVRRMDLNIVNIAKQYAEVVKA